MWASGTLSRGLSSSLSTYTGEIPVDGSRRQGDSGRVLLPEMGLDGLVRGWSGWKRSTSIAILLVEGEGWVGGSRWR